MNPKFFRFDTNAFEIDGNIIHRSVKGTAYSGKPITNHPHWGNVVFDLSTTRSEQVIPLLLQHDPAKIAGYTDRVDIGSSIMFSGSLLQNTDPGKEVARLADEGFPWQMSVHIHPEHVIEVRDEIVNGVQFSGTVFKESLIREISFCPVGADAGTSANVFDRSKEGNYLADLMQTQCDQFQKENLFRR